jgi:putative FmdB family regulatory protein
MPLYEYECLACGERSEILQRFSDPPLAACPKCGGEVKKLLSSPAFQFKGTGWYATDYAGKKGDGRSGGKSDGEGSKAEKGADKGEAGASGAKADAKAETPAKAAAPAKD